jgi:BlaI family penicillinase repressor
LSTQAANLYFLTAIDLYVTYCNATMTNTKLNRLKRARLKNMGEVEQLVMDYIWTHGPSSSEACREGLAASRPMKDSTIRTVLRRLEEKGFLTHETQGRTFIYEASDARQNVAVRAVKAIIDRFCGGSAEQLVLGMVDNAVLNRKQLERLARKISERTVAERSAAGKMAADKKEGQP